MASPTITVHGTASTPRHIFLVDMMDEEKTETACYITSVSGRPSMWKSIDWYRRKDVSVLLGWLILGHFWGCLHSRTVSDTDSAWTVDKYAFQLVVLYCWRTFSEHWNSEISATGIQYSFVGDRQCGTGIDAGIFQNKLTMVHWNPVTLA